MYFRFPQQYVAVLNLFLIGIIVYFLALGVRNGIKLHLARTETLPIPEFGGQKPSRQSRIEPRPRAFYDTIVQRNIFTNAPVAPIAAPIQENLDITLIGTSQLSVGKPFIIVESTDGQQSLYRQGETIPNIGRVLSISRNQAIVLHNGHPVALKIPNAGEDGTSEPMLFGRRRHGLKRPKFLRRGDRFGAYGGVGSAGGVHQLGPNRYLIGRATLDHNLSNMGSLLTQVHAAPNLENGTTNGFRLSQIQPGSIFQQIGLQDGDIVTGAQGQQVTDPMRAMALVSALRNSPSISLSVIRNGSPLKFKYNIR